MYEYTEGCICNYESGNGWPRFGGAFRMWVYTFIMAYMLTCFGKSLKAVDNIL